jgi:hypothetical protein
MVESVPADLGRYQEVGAAALHRPAQKLLGVAASVDIRGIEEIDPAFEGRLDGVEDVLVFSRSPVALGHGPESDTDLRHLDAAPGTERASLQSHILTGHAPPLRKPQTLWSPLFLGSTRDSVAV